MNAAAALGPYTARGTGFDLLGSGSGAARGMRAGGCATEREPRSIALGEDAAALSDRQYFRYDIDVPEVGELWRRGSVTASWLLRLTGEGRWTLHAAADDSVPVPVLSAALYERFSSHGESHFADQLLSATRPQFGGHHELPASDGAGAAS